jgi:hypothetical protein
MALALMVGCSAQEDDDVLPAGGESSVVDGDSQGDSGGDSGGNSGGSGDSGGAGDAGNALSAEDAALKFVECMREQGVEMDDPTSGGGIKLHVTPETEALVNAAQETCQPIMDQAAPNTMRDPERDEEHYEKLLAVAQCMRDKGHDYPDPEMDSAGRIAQKFRANQDSALDPEVLQRDQEECYAAAGMDDDAPQMSVEDPAGPAEGGTGTGGDGLSFDSTED